MTKELTEYSFLDLLELDDGDPAVAARIGQCLRTGRGVAADMETARKFLLYAKEHGAANNIGAELREAASDYRQMDDNTLCSAAYSKDNRAIEEFLKRACERPDDYNRRNVAELFKIAVDSFRGGGVAYQAARCYEYGVGTDIDEQKAFVWYCNASDCAGGEKSLKKLAEIYRTGRLSQSSAAVVAPDPTKAAVYEFRSAQLSSATAEEIAGVAVKLCAKENGYSAIFSKSRENEWICRAVNAALAENGNEKQFFSTVCEEMIDALVPLYPQCGYLFPLIELLIEKLSYPVVSNAALMQIYDSRQNNDYSYELACWYISQDEEAHREEILRLMRNAPDERRKQADDYLARYYDRAGDVDSFMALTADSSSFDDDIRARRLSRMLSVLNADWRDVCDELNAMRENGFAGETEFLDQPQNVEFKDFYIQYENFRSGRISDEERVALGSRFLSGDHVACDRSFAVKELILPAAENGFAPALRLICSEKYPFNEVLLSDASVRTAADLGISQACVAYADRLADQGDAAAAMTYYPKGVDADPTRCYEKMGELYSKPNSAVYHPQKAMACLREAMHNGSRRAEKILKERGLYELSDLTERAENGDLAAKKKLGMIFRSGNQFGKDIPLAMQYLSEVAAQDYETARIVAMDYLYGDKDGYDFEKAEKYINYMRRLNPKAARDFTSKGIYFVDKLLRSGNESKISAEARKKKKYDDGMGKELRFRLCKWLAENGSINGSNNRGYGCYICGCMLASGDGVPRNTERAWYYFSRGKEVFDKDCIKYLDERPGLRRIGAMLDRSEKGIASASDYQELAALYRAGSYVEKNLQLAWDFERMSKSAE